MQRIEDTRHGFTVEIPDEVKYKQLRIGYVFGHPSLSGLMMLLYHRNETMEEMKTEMYAGFFDESGYNIQVDGHLNEVSEVMVLADYKGKAEGNPAKGFGIGMLSPHGGGFLLATISTPDNFSEAHMNFIEDLARNVNFMEPLLKDGEDEWTDFLQNKTVVGKQSMERDEPIGFKFHDGDTFETIYEDRSKTHMQETFEAGEANLKGQWEIMEAMDQYVLRLIFFDGSEKQFTLRLKDRETLLMNEEEWEVRSS